VRNAGRALYPSPAISQPARGSASSICPVVYYIGLRRRLREGLSRLGVCAGLIVGNRTPLSRSPRQPRGSCLDITTLMRTASRIEAIRLAITHGDDAWGPAFSFSARLHQRRPAISKRTGDEIPQAAPGFLPLHTCLFHFNNTPGYALAAFGSPPRMLTPHSYLSVTKNHYRTLYQNRLVMSGISQTAARHSCTKHQHARRLHASRATDCRAEPCEA